MVEPDPIWDAFMNYSIDAEQEDDGRWIAEVPELPGVLAYGSTKEEAQARAQVLALRVIAERLEHGEERPIDVRITVPAA
jgi:predicted RNase H-like HicB family nuclease